MKEQESWSASTCIPNDLLITMINTLLQSSPQLIVPVLVLTSATVYPSFHSQPPPPSAAMGNPQ